MENNQTKYKLVGGSRDGETYDDSGRRQYKISLLIQPKPVFAMAVSDLELESVEFKEETYHLESIHNHRQIIYFYRYEKINLELAVRMILEGYNPKQ